MERNKSIVIPAEGIAYAKHQIETTDISKYCTLNDNVLTIHDHEGYTDELNKYWHHRLNIKWHLEDVSDEVH